MRGEIVPLQGPILAHANLYASPYSAVRGSYPFDEQKRLMGWGLHLKTMSFFDTKSPATYDTLLEYAAGHPPWSGNENTGLEVDLNLLVLSHDPSSFHACDHERPVPGS